MTGNVLTLLTEKPLREKRSSGRAAHDFIASK